MWIKLVAMVGFAGVVMWSVTSGALFTVTGAVAQWLVGVALN